MKTYFAFATIFLLGAITWTGAAWTPEESLKGPDAETSSSLEYLQNLPPKQTDIQSPPLKLYTPEKMRKDTQDRQSAADIEGDDNNVDEHDNKETAERTLVHIDTVEEVDFSAPQSIVDVQVDGDWDKSRASRIMVVGGHEVLASSTNEDIVMVAEDFAAHASLAPSSTSLRVVLGRQPAPLESAEEDAMLDGFSRMLQVSTSSLFVHFVGASTVHRGKDFLIRRSSEYMLETERAHDGPFRDDSPKPEEHEQSAFKAIDADQDGTVTVHEFAEAMATKFSHAIDAILDTKLAKAKAVLKARGLEAKMHDRSEEEIDALLQSRPEGLSETDMRKVLQLFDLMDLDGSGSLERQIKPEVHDDEASGETDTDAESEDTEMYDAQAEVDYYKATSSQEPDVQDAEEDDDAEMYDAQAEVDYYKATSSQEPNAFSKLDHNQDGAVTVQELAQAMATHYMGQIDTKLAKAKRVTQARGLCNARRARAVRRHTGKRSFEEMAALLESRPESLSETEMRQVMEMFDLIDMDSNGSLEREAVQPASVTESASSEPTEDQPKDEPMEETTEDQGAPLPAKTALFVDDERTKSEAESMPSGNGGTYVHNMATLDATVTGPVDWCQACTGNISVVGGYKVLLAQNVASLGKYSLRSDLSNSALGPLMCKLPLLSLVSGASTFKRLDPDCGGDGGSTCVEIAGGVQSAVECQAHCSAGKILDACKFINFSPKWRVCDLLTTCTPHEGNKKAAWSVYQRESVENGKVQLKLANRPPVPLMKGSQEEEDLVEGLSRLLKVRKDRVHVRISTEEVHKPLSGEMMQQAASAFQRGKDFVIKTVKAASDLPWEGRCFRCSGQEQNAPVPSSNINDTALPPPWELSMTPRQLPALLALASLEKMRRK